MPQPQTDESPERLEVAPPVHRGVRVALAVLAAVRRTARTVPLGDVVDVDLGVRAGSDGDPSYRVRFERFFARGAGSVPVVPR